MLPNTLLRAGIGQAILVELKNGETYSGELVNCDPYMNLNLKTVYCTSKDGDRFWEIPYIHIRGMTVKYVCLKPEVMALVQEDVQYQKRSLKRGRGRGRGRLGVNK